MARPSRWSTPALGYSPRRDGTAAGASTSSGFRKCAPMPHRGQETVTRVLRLSRRRDILRRTRPTRVYPHCARHVSRSCRFSVVCTPRYDACATKVIVRGGAHAGPRTLGHPPSGCGIDPRFFGIAQASPAGRSSAAARPGGFNGNAFCNKICQCTKSLRDSPLKRVAHLQARSQTRD